MRYEQWRSLADEGADDQSGNRSDNDSLPVFYDEFLDVIPTHELLLLPNSNHQADDCDGYETDCNS